jgi:hypothetical protein
MAVFEEIAHRGEACPDCAAEFERALAHRHLYRSRKGESSRNAGEIAKRHAFMHGAPLALGALRVEDQRRVRGVRDSPIDPQCSVDREGDD